MTQEWTVPAWAVLVAVLGVLVLLAALVLALRARTTRLGAQAAELQAQVDAIERRLAEPAAAPGPETPRGHPSYVITRLGDEPDPPPAEARAEVVPPAVFADTVLREGAVQSAALLHGLRRALSPESRNRIRFAVRQEVKRSRKTRRAEQRAALREWQARARSSSDAA